MRAERFNSRTPGGVRPGGCSPLRAPRTFQFTHPGRGATVVRSLTAILRAFQFTHPGRGATQFVPYNNGVGGVSIHAPREGCDPCELKEVFTDRTFQFTHPGRGATPTTTSTRRSRRVSIHAPREGCDCGSAISSYLGTGFNSRTPGGVRHTITGIMRAIRTFQFTHPGRGATLRL